MPGECKVLKFNRRAGVILLENTEPSPKPSSVIELVRDLLTLLKRLLVRRAG
jgi:hypothetical protein